MEATCSERHTRAFVLSTDVLKKIWAVIEQRIGSLCAEATCKDGLERRFEDLKGLLAFENAPSQRIVNLALSAHAKDFSKRADIEFSDGYYLDINSLNK